VFSPTTDSIPSTPTRATAQARPRVIATIQTLLLTVIFLMPAIGCLRVACVVDPDIWWHLATGDWIALHHAIPHTALFTRTLAAAPWQEYSWLFDLLTSRLFHAFGLVGIVVYTTAMVLAITVALFSLIRELYPNFSIAVLLTFVAGVALLHIETPRPWLFSILFFILELHILFRARRTGNWRNLMWLTLLFALWANIHIQFIEGLIVLAIALAESLFQRRLPASTTRLRPLALACTLITCLTAILINPYGWHLYQAAYTLSTLGGSLSTISELQSIAFRDLPDFTVLFLTLAAVAALARQRRLLIFETALLLFAAVVSFHSLRDVWVVAVAAVAVIAATIPNRATPQHISSLATPLAALTTVILCLLTASSFALNNTRLVERRAQVMPSAAAAFVRDHHLAGPLYNGFNWGGYLLWELNLPDAIDGRSTIYDDKALDRSLASWNGQQNWATDPQLQSAALIIGPANAPLTHLLRPDPAFHLAYEDRQAAVFTHHPTP